MCPLQFISEIHTLTKGHPRKKCADQKTSLVQLLPVQGQFAKNFWVIMCYSDHPSDENLFET